MNIKASIGITRPRGTGPDRISIRLTDETSRITFFKGSMKLEDFTEALFGMSGVEIEGEVHGLQNVGKHKIREQREIVCPLKDYSRDKLGAWLEDNAKEDGWIVNPYLGSSGSVEAHPEGQLLRYSVTKYVDEKPAEQP